MLTAVCKTIACKSMTSAIIYKVGRTMQYAPFRRFVSSTYTPNWESLASPNVTRPSSKYPSVDVEQFMSAFPHLVKDVMELVSKYDDTDVSKWLEQAILYNVPNGKCNRGLLTVIAYKSLMADLNEPVATDQLRRVQHLGWCVELLKAVFLIADDFMDHSETRRGLPCWYKVHGVGGIAIMDSIMLQNYIYPLLRKLSEQKNYHASLVVLFHEAMIATAIGGLLNKQMAKQRVDYFTMKRYTSIVHNKTAFSSFYLPVASAMLIAGLENAAHFQEAKRILYAIGHYRQVKDDFLNCFGDPQVTGKIGTDIQDNKCSWFATLAMEKGDADDKQIMRECYGQTDAKKVERVQQLYEKLGLAQMYATYEDQTYSLIKQWIQELPKNIPHGIFYLTMDMIYQRNQ